MALWKKKPQKTLPTTPTEYPSGIAVQTEKSAYMIQRDGKRYRIQSEQILASWKFPVVVETTEAALANYPVAVTKLAFRDGTLLTNIADGKIYLVSESRLRHVIGVDALNRLGLKTSDAMVVSDADINIMKLGANIT